MKKGIASILFIFYFAFSSGIVINLHYCMNKFDSSKLGAAKSDVCGKCGMHTEDSNGCCHDVVKVIKIQDDQQVSTIHVKFTAPETTDLVYSHKIDQLTNNKGNCLLFSNHSPPFNKQDTYLVNCVFRI
jgi:hypothetical protein